MAKSSKCPLLACSSCLLLVLLLSGCTLATSGKRFDCRLFCKMTGYHGMIGGCRCSFTLFAAKRNDPLWVGKPMDLQDATGGEYQPLARSLLDDRAMKADDDYIQVDDIRPVRKLVNSRRTDSRYNWN